MFEAFLVGVYVLIVFIITPFYIIRDILDALGGRYEISWDIAFAMLLMTTGFILLTVTIGILVLGF